MIQSVMRGKLARRGFQPRGQHQHEGPTTSTTGAPSGRLPGAGKAEADPGPASFHDHTVLQRWNAAMLQLLAVLDMSGPGAVVATAAHCCTGWNGLLAPRTPRTPRACVMVALLWHMHTLCLQVWIGVCVGPHPGRAPCSSPHCSWLCGWRGPASGTRRSTPWYPRTLRSSLHGHCWALVHLWCRCVCPVSHPTSHATSHRPTRSTLSCPL